MNKILIQGYYGFSNLGDDILLLVAYGWVKELFPYAEIVVFANNPDTKQNLYISKLLNSKTRTINYSAQEHFDLIVHGGGGIHYDFERGSVSYLLFNSFIRTIGAHLFLKAFKFYKRIKGKENITAGNRIGIGIGVGLFTSSSKKFYSNIPILGDYDYLLVRDAASVERARSINKKVRVTQSSDLAFATDYWHTILKPKVEGNTLRLGFVLRSWKYSDNHICEVIQIASNLASQGIQITFYSFDVEHDRESLKLIGSQHRVIIWEPEMVEVEDFFLEFQSEDLIITSRFHGAILASTFGVSSICLVIEPKLASVKEILATSCQLVELESIALSLQKLIITTLGEIKSWKEKAISDFKRNRSLVINGLIEAKNYVKKQ